MTSGIAEKESAAVRAFSNTFLLECRRGHKDWEVWSALGTMRYQLGTVDTSMGKVVYRSSAPGIYMPPEYLPKLAMDVAKRAGLRIVY